MSAAGTPKASEAAIAAVQEALGCNLTPRQTRAITVDGFTIGGGIETGCQTHRDQYGFPQKSERGCPVAVAAADAAAPWIAAQALRDAAEELGDYPTWRQALTFNSGPLADSQWLREQADWIEAGQ